VLLRFRADQNTAEKMAVELFAEACREAFSGNLEAKREIPMATKNHRIPERALLL
jgi:hypothetical protein